MTATAPNPRGRVDILLFRLGEALSPRFFHPSEWALIRPQWQEWTRRFEPEPQRKP